MDGFRRVGIGVVALAAAACTSPPRPVEDPERGCRYVAPAGWRTFDGELRSGDGSLLMIRVYDLTGAERGFLAGLPESVVPQLETWAREYYVVEGDPERRPATLGREPALELTYGVRLRPKDPLQPLTYWIATHGGRLYVLRAVLAADSARDVEAARQLVASWEFIEAVPPRARAAAAPRRARILLGFLVECAVDLATRGEAKANA